MLFNKDKYTKHAYSERKVALSVRIKTRDLSSLYYLEESLCYLHFIFLLGETARANSVNPDTRDNSGL